MVAAVVSLAHNNVQVILTTALGGLDALLEHVLCLLDEQAVQIDGIFLDAAVGVVLAEDVVARLAVVLLHLGGMLFSLGREVVGARAVARLVGLVGAVEARAALGCFLAGEVAEAVVLGFGVVVGVVERLGRMLAMYNAIAELKSYSASPLTSFPWRTC